MSKLFWRTQIVNLIDSNCEKYLTILLSQLLFEKVY